MTQLSTHSRNFYMWRNRIKVWRNCICVWHNSTYMWHTCICKWHRSIVCNHVCDRTHLGTYLPNVFQYLIWDMPYIYIYIYFFFLTHQHLQVTSLNTMKWCMWQNSIRYLPAERFSISHMRHALYIYIYIYIYISLTHQHLQVTSLNSMQSCMWQNSIRYLPTERFITSHMGHA